MKSFLSLLFLGFFNQLAVAQFAQSAEDICPLLIGEKIPNQMVVSSIGKEVLLLEAFEEKRTVLVFYRGG